MKKIVSLILSSLMIMAFLSSCSDSKQTKTETVKAESTETKTPQVKSGGGDFAIDAINDQVKGFYITGFPGGSAKLSKNEDLENMKKIVALVKPLIAQIPDGYVMQMTGHCANYESDSVQKTVSTNRAAKVYNELKKAGAAASKMSYKGVGSSEPVGGYSDKDVKQRCVSFKAIKK